MFGARTVTIAVLAAALGCDEGSLDPDGGGGGSGGEPAELAGTLAAHNQARDALGLPLMTWDAELAGIAQGWADGCEWGHNPARSDGYPTYVGENIYGTGAAPSGPDAVASWLSEESSYDYDSNTCSDTCGHYTQVVWRESVKLGCGISTCAGGLNMVVCNYAPGGNVGGRRPY